jgi:hypothetical protein
MWAILNMVIEFLVPKGVYLTDNLLHGFRYIYSLLKTLITIEQGIYPHNVRCIAVYYCHYDIS